MEFPGRSGSSDRSFGDMFQSASSVLSSHSDLLQGASSLFSSTPQQPSHAPKADEPPTEALHSGVEADKEEDTKGPSYGDAMSSAQVLFQAAKAKFHGGEGEGEGEGEAQEIDTGSLAGALGNLVGAAGHYGKLDDKSKYGEYVHKAEEYLHSYEHKHQHPSAHGRKPAQREDQDD
eukprot:c21122_g1_i1 orf=199-726(+)